MFYLEHFGLTDAGKVRENNEDSLLVGTGRDETLFAVADGIGGFEAGEVASRMAVDVLKNTESRDRFEDSITEANRRIRAASRGDERMAGMGTTVVAVRFGGTSQRPVAEIAHVGDARAYLVRGGRLRPLTEDHSLVAEMVKSGDLTREEAAEHPQRNLITRALGVEESVSVDTAIIPVEANDRVMLCSDGLSDMVSEARIQEILTNLPEDPEAPVKLLLEDALAAGGSDNITVIVVDVRERRSRGRSNSNGTQEMPAVGSVGYVGSTGGFSGGAPEDERPKGRRRGSGKRSGLLGRILGGLVRGIAVIAVLALAASPVYLWASGRYFLDEGPDEEVVAYQGLPWTVAGVSFNKSWRETGVPVNEVNVSTRASVRDNTLYTHDEIDEVITQLKRDAKREASREASRESRRDQRDRNDNQSGETR